MDDYLEEILSSNDEKYDLINSVQEDNDNLSELWLDDNDDYDQNLVELFNRGVE